MTSSDDVSGYLEQMRESGVEIAWGTPAPRSYAESVATTAELTAHGFLQ